MSSAIARTWLEIADRDIDAVRRSMIADPEPNAAVAAYHCQQAVEKIIKSALVHHQIPILRGSAGHDLRRLVGLLPMESGVREVARDLTRLTPWATAFRYPADDPFTSEPLPTVAEIAMELNAILRLREKALEELNLYK